MSRVAIYSYNIRALFTERAEQGTGGAEFQLTTLARRLRESGHEVVFLVGDVQEDAEEVIDGYRFIKCFSREQVSSLAKFRYLWAALRCADADVLVERGSSTVSVWLSLFARLKRRRFVFCGASDINFATDELDPAFTTRLQQRVFHWALRSSGAVIAQKTAQQRIAAEQLGLRATVVRNFPPPPAQRNDSACASDVLWVSNIIPYKQPELVLKLAQAMPERTFVMIGGSRSAAYFERIRSAAVSIPNLRFIGYVPAQEVGGYLLNTSMVLNTTKVQGKYEEGFPNIFLQAWQEGIPVVSLVSDPDGCIEEYGLGKCSRSEERLFTDVRSLLEDTALRRTMGDRGREYVRQVHDPEEIVNDYLRILQLPRHA